MGVFFYIYIFFCLLYTLLGVFVFSRRENVLPNRILGVNLVVLPVFFVYYAYLMEGLFEGYTVFFDIFWFVNFLFGPLLFLYIRSMLGGGLNWKRDFIHFIAPFIAISISFSTCNWGGETLRETYLVGMIDINYEGNSLIFKILKGGFVLQYSFYLIQSITIIHRHQAFLRSLGTSQSLSVIKWLKYLIYFKSPIFILTLAFYSVTFNPLIVESVPVFHFTIYCFILTQLIKQPYAFTGIAPDRIAKEFGEMSGWKKKRQFGEEQLQCIYEDAKICISKKQLYSNQQLSIEHLADELEQPILLLLYALDKHAKVTFEKFVMLCRIEAAEQMLTNEQYTDNSIEFIAFELGFETASDFEYIFEKYMGVKPKEYREK